MASSKTPNFALPQWQGTDPFSMAEFNETFAKIDTALGGTGNAHIAFGTYTGTGLAGAQNPNTLTFPFAPKLVVIKRIGDGTLPTLLLGGGDNTARSISHTFGGGELTVSTEENSISWYHSGNTWTATSASSGDPNAFYQLNTANANYNYVALG